MSCDCEPKGPRLPDHKFPSSVIEINNPEKIILFRKVIIPASMGDETMVPPVIGKYRNVLLVYEVNANIYLYSSDGIPTKLTVDVDELERQIAELANEVGLKANTSDLSAVAFSGEYSDLLNEPQDFTTDEWNNLWV